IGNHEVMNVLGDLRYVHPGEYAAFRSNNAKALQQRAFEVLSDSTRRKDAAYREEWLAAHPLGWVEHRMAFEANGKYASWIRGNASVVRINDWLFLHGGIGPKYADTALAALNDGVRRALDPTRPPPEGNMAEDPEGPLWYRGLATGSEDSLAAHVDRVLTHLNVRHIAIGHSVSPGAIFPRFGGKVVLIDVGLAAAYQGPPAALVIEDGQAFALHRGTQLPLPLGGDLLPYLKAAAALDPQPSKLQAVIDQLGAARVPR
ncbi:MAG: protein-tyrosine-phosphatase, partial [Gemmatimonadetes bacterium]|nr:protein-tyrosine-phosphatase [Gemmatimonadota bacterium]